jgi:hypothetical protein
VNRNALALPSGGPVEMAGPPDPAGSFGSVDRQRVDRQVVGRQWSRASLESRAGARGRSSEGSAGAGMGAADKGEGKGEGHEKG